MKEAHLPLQASAYFGQQQESNKRSLSSSSPNQFENDMKRPELNADLLEGYQD